MTDSPWVEWHRGYDTDDSPLQMRLRIVQREIRAALDVRGDRPTRVVSMCAGQGRDLLGVLAGHPAGERVSARLVELDPVNAARARADAAAAGLDAVEVVEADAGRADVYVGAVPAHLVLACGVFGNVSDDDIERTVLRLPELCAPGARVLWTRHRVEPDLNPTIRGWFERSGFRETGYHAPDGHLFAVGAAELTGSPRSLRADERLFTFVGFDALHAPGGAADDPRD